jgi:hypothetical protein
MFAVLTENSNRSELSLKGKTRGSVSPDPYPAKIKESEEIEEILRICTGKLN